MASPSRRPSAWIPLCIGLLGAIAFLVGRSLDLYSLRMLSKGVPMVVLCAVVLRRSPDRYSRWIAAGLVASLAGDLLLELSPATFAAGLVAFLSAHILYIKAFLSRSRELRPALALPFAAWGGLAFFTLAPGLGAMRLPVAIYTLAITVMGWRATALLGAPASTGEPMRTAAGAILFLLSDTLLAFNRFHEPIEGAGYGIILLYWAGQVGIAASAWSSARPRGGVNGVSPEPPGR